MIIKYIMRFAPGSSGFKQRRLLKWFPSHTPMYLTAPKKRGRYITGGRIYGRYNTASGTSHKILLQAWRSSQSRINSTGAYGTRNYYTIVQIFIDV